MAAPGVTAPPTTEPEAGSRSGAEAGAAKAEAGPAGAEAGPAGADRQRKQAVPSARERHLLNRFTYGISADLAKEVRDAGEVDAWFEAQLNPDSVPDPDADVLQSWFPVLSLSPLDLWQASLIGTTNVPAWSTDFQRWTLLRHLVSKRQVAERMAAFWSDLLYIAVPDGKSFTHRFSYDATIREHALGHFDDLLVAAETHPAMGCWLDNAASTRTQLNENLGREVLELHTVGREAAFSEAEVLDSARILTGYRVRTYDTWEAYYAPTDHYVGPVEVLGFRSSNADRDGRPVTEAYLRHLARHPATARRVAHRLCIWFVQDTPSEAIVEAVASTFLSSGTDIKATLRTLVSHPDFFGSAGLKLRTPVEDVVAMYRALRLRPRPPQVAADLANVLVWHAAAVGQRPFDWPRPDGPPDEADAWASVGRMISSWRIHYAVAVNSMTVTGVDAPAPASWLPRLPADIETIIDNACRLLLARPATASMIKSTAQRMNIAPTAKVDRREQIEDWRIQQMLGGLLDTPAHFFH